MESAKTPGEVCAREFIQYLGNRGKTFSVNVTFEPSSAFELDRVLSNCVPVELAGAMESQLLNELHMDVLGDSTLHCEPLENGDLRVHCNERVLWVCGNGQADPNQILTELLDKAERKFARLEDDCFNNSNLWPPDVAASVETAPDGSLSTKWEELVAYDSCGEEYPLNAAQEAQLKQFIVQEIFLGIPEAMNLEEVSFDVEFSVGRPNLLISTCRQAIDTVLPSSSLNDEKRYLVDLSLLSEL